MNSSCPALNRSSVVTARDASPFSFAIPLVGSFPLPAGTYCSFDFPVTNPTRVQNAANVSAQLRSVLAPKRIIVSKPKNVNQYNLVSNLQLFVSIVFGLIAFLYVFVLTGSSTFLRDTADILPDDIPSSTVQFCFPSHNCFSNFCFFG